MNSTTWTRRQFAQTLALGAAATLTARSAAAFSPAEAHGIAVIGSGPDGDSEGALHVFRVTGKHWQLLQTEPAAAPAYLLQHPTSQVLYAVHNVAEWNHLPCGAVSAYAVDRRSGKLTFWGTQPLSLAATNPSHAALTADGTHLVVAAEGGGMYNLLPIAADGGLLPVSSIRKELGLGDGERFSTSAPRQVVMHPDGSLLTIDAGQESLTRFHLRDGDLALQHRTHIHAGSGPTQLALGAGGMHVYTLSDSTGAIAVHPLRAGHLNPLEIYSAALGTKYLAAHPQGNFLLAGTDRSVAVLRMDRQSGRLTSHSQLGSMGSQPVFSSDGGHLFGLDLSTGTVRLASFQAESGEAGVPATVARVDNARSLLFLSATA
ncbi:MAG: lactonase family protein [Janthinobacterium lividum]